MIKDKINVISSRNISNIVFSEKKCLVVIIDKDQDINALLQDGMQQSYVQVYASVNNFSRFTIL